MGLKANVCLIKSEKEISDEKLMKILGYKGIPKRNSNLDKQLATQTNFAIGEFEGVKILCHYKLIFTGIDSQKPSLFERRLTETFKNATIASIGLQSAANVYGYSLLKDKKKIRVNAGSINGKLFEFGKPTPEEQKVYNQYRYDADKGLWYDTELDRWGDESMFGEDLALAIADTFFSFPFIELNLKGIGMRCYDLEYVGTARGIDVQFARFLNRSIGRLIKAIADAIKR